MKHTFLLVALIVFFTSCDTEEISKRPISEADMWNCYKDSEWTDAKIKNALIGKWKWIYSESYWAPDKGNNTENENTVIEFLNDSSLQISVNGEPIGVTNWTIEFKDGELYGLLQDSTITTLLYGRILICGETAMFNNSYIDGSDNYFKKIN